MRYQDIAIRPAEMKISGNANAGKDAEKPVPLPPLVRM